MGTAITAVTSLNFGLLRAVSPTLETTGAQAERLLHVDPAACVAKVRALVEMLGGVALSALGTNPAGLMLNDRIRELNRVGALTSDVRTMFTEVRDAGNRAAHENAATQSDALRALRLAWHLAVWCRRTVEPGTFKQPPWTEVPDPSEAQRALAAQVAELTRALEASREAAEATRTEARSLAEESAAYRAKLEEALRSAERADEERALWATLADEAAAQLQASMSQRAAENTADDALSRAQEAGSSEALDLDEADTRVLVDAQLRAAGWEADTESLTYARGARPAANRALAIAEWPTRDGVADYALFDGITAVAVIEAKRKRIDVPGAIEQARRYSRAWVQDGTHTLPAGAPWDGHNIPLLFATNGRAYLAQLPDRSGIHMLDARRATNLPRVLAGWYSPEGVRALLSTDLEAAHAKLSAEPVEALGLRPYQGEAIAAVERALSEGRRHCLLAMATGTGKTRTALGLIYRLLKSRRARRVLFLVDRDVLAQQTLETFDKTPVDGTLTLSQIYDVQGNDASTPLPEARVHIATVQSLVRRVMYAASVYDVPRVDTYDVVIVDECHRGYALDRDLSEVELGFRDERAYLSKYRRVLDHFDAARVGITATPALHTTEIFGRPIYEYTFRQAVLDGHLVDSDLPYRIETRLAREGIHYGVGDTVTVYDRSAQTVDLATLEDDLHLDVETFNREVITEGFNRAVCGVLASKIDPEARGKTLVFCVDDAHADLVVRLLREALQAAHGAVEAAAVQKITGRSDNVRGLVKRYQNEHHPLVAVTVDLLTTGVDVPAITSLVFLRMVRSRVLYEQMLGRATRPWAGKSSFAVYDAVGVTDAMRAVTAMRPVVTNPVFRFEQLAGEVRDETLGDDARALALEQLVAKLQRRRRTLSDAALTELESAAGLDAASLVRQLRVATPAEAAAWLRAHPGAVRVLDEGQTRPDLRYVSDQADEVLRAGPSLGMAPDDYLDAFGAWVDAHVNEVPALKAALQRPRDLTREGLKSVREALEEAGFNESKVRTAWRMKSNHEIAATIVGFIRQRAIGEALVPYETRVDHALEGVLRSREWTDEQRRWLTRIASQMKAEVVVDRGALDRGAFTTIGGARRAERVFEGHLDEVLGDMVDAVWGANAAG